MSSAKEKNLRHILEVDVCEVICLQIRTFMLACEELSDTVLSLIPLDYSK